MSLDNLHPNTDAFLKSLLIDVETFNHVNPDYTPYGDSNGYATVGIGFNINYIRNPLVSTYYVNALGIDPNDTRLSEDQKNVEQQYFEAVSNLKRNSGFSG